MWTLAVNCLFIFAFITSKIYRRIQKPYLLRRQDPELDALVPLVEKYTDQISLMIETRNRITLRLIEENYHLQYKLFAHLQGKTTTLIDDEDYDRTKALQQELHWTAKELCVQKKDLDRLRGEIKYASEALYY